METVKRGFKIMNTYIPEEIELQRYYDDICKYELLSRKEEEELFKTMHKWSNNKAKCGQRTRRNGKAAREKLINSNLRLVAKIAKDYKNMGFPLSDLIAEGNMGLMKGVEKFKSDKKAKLSTYASFWIKQCIFRAFDNKSRLVRVPSDAGRKYPKILKWIQEYKDLCGESPTNKEIAIKFKTSEERVVAIMTARQTPFSLDYQMTSPDGETNSTFGDILPDEKPDPKENTEINENTEILMDLISKLDHREQSILCFRFGLNNKKTETLDEIGVRFKVTRERIRQVETKALRKLRRMVRNKYKIEVDDFSQVGFLITHF
jgi:RNA polymerase primary sigma factor